MSVLPLDSVPTPPPRDGAIAPGLRARDPVTPGRPRLREGRGGPGPRLPRPQRLTRSRHGTSPHPVLSGSDGGLVTQV